MFAVKNVMDQNRPAQTAPSHHRKKRPQLVSNPKQNVISMRRRPAAAAPMNQGPT
jgi:hypothetical protein